MEKLYFIPELNELITVNTKGSIVKDRSNKQIDLYLHFGKEKIKIPGPLAEILGLIIYIGEL